MCAYRLEKIDKDHEDLVISGWESGIAASPHKGIANIQNANIDTETGEIMASYGRIQQSQSGNTSASHTISPLDSSHLSADFALVSGNWITITASTISGLSTGTYYVTNSTGTGSGGLATTFTISSTYNIGGSQISGFGLTGTATFHMTRVPGRAIATATEAYTNGASQPGQYRYYILDANSFVWVYDTAAFAFNGIEWFLPDPFNLSVNSAVPSGIAVLNGWLFAFVGNFFCVKSTVNLGNTTTFATTWVTLDNSVMMGPPLTPNKHFGFVGHQGKLYYTDGNYLGMWFPDTSIVPTITGLPNIQSFCSYTVSTTTGTISNVFNGSTPSNGVIVGGTGYLRIPAVFFTSSGGTLPSTLTADTVFYIQYSPSNGTPTFEVYVAATGGSALNLASGSPAGTMYFNTFYPIGAHAGPGGDVSTVTFTPQRLNLPAFEVSQCMGEIGNTIIVGTASSTAYPWDQIQAVPSDLISIPESNCSSMVNVNNMMYLFVGNKGNIYITNGSVASHVISVPDYCAGIAGTPNSYIEPYFTWGGSMYVRGRVYFSILDQTFIPNSSTVLKAGNCGGVWSFNPTQNLYIGQDVGTALRLENQNSYGAYNGVATILIPAQTQAAKSPQYWSAWYSTIDASTVTYGIDFTATTPTSAYAFETELIPVGTILNKKSFAQFEYKLATPLANGETVQLYQRTNGTDTYVSLGTVVTETSNPLSGYFTSTIQNAQWLQIYGLVTPLFSSSSSFGRLTELRIR